MKIVDLRLFRARAAAGLARPVALPVAPDSAPLFLDTWSYSLAVLSLLPIFTLLALGTCTVDVAFLRPAWQNFSLAGVNLN